MFCRVAMAGLFVGLAGCTKPAVDTGDVIVLQTGRLRGNVYPLDLQADAPLQHWQFLAGYVKAVREEAAATGARVLLVDLGDSLGGSFAAHATGSENMVAFFNGLAYDALALSNLDSSAMPALLGKLKAPVVNPFADAGGQPATAGTSFATSFEKSGLPVSILANFYGDVDSAGTPDRFPAWFGTTPSGVVPLRDYGPVVEGLPPKAGGALRLLTWMKFESSGEVPAAFLSNLKNLGVDAILAHRIYGGDRREAWTQDSLVPWDPPVSVNILRNNGGFAVARIDLKREGDSWKVIDHRLVPMTANTAPADEEIVRMISRFAPAISDADKKVATLPELVDQDSILTAYMNALALVPSTDAVLYSAQSVRSDWPAGELRASRVFNSLPWTTPIVQIKLTPDQLARAAKNLALRSTVRDGTTDAEVLNVTTSKFFADLITRTLAPDVIAAPTGIDSEFDYFVEVLQRSPEILQGSGTVPPAESPQRDYP